MVSMYNFYFIILKKMYNDKLFFKVIQTTTMNSVQFNEGMLNMSKLMTDITSFVFNEREWQEAALKFVNDLIF